MECYLYVQRSVRIIYVCDEKWRESAQEREVFRPVAEEFRCVTLSCSDVSLQEAPPTAVTSGAEGYKYDPRAKEERLCQSQRSSLDLPLLPIQKQLLSPALSASDGTATLLSSLERQAIRMRGRPWKSYGLAWTICSSIIPYGSPGSGWLRREGVSSLRSWNSMRGKLPAFLFFPILLRYSTSCLP